MNVHDITSVLDPKSGWLPGGEKVERIRVKLGTDHIGDDAVYVWVILRDSKRPRGWKDVEATHEAIWQRLQELIPSRWPYISFRTATEDAKLTKSEAA